MELDELIKVYNKSKSKELLNQIIDTVKKGGYSYIYATMDEDLLLKDIDGISFFELLLKHSEDVGFDWRTKQTIRDNPTLIDLLVKYNRLSFFDYSGQIAMLADYKGKPLIEHFFEIDKVTPSMINTFTSSNLIIKLCIQYNKKELLKHLRSEKLLCEELSDNKTVLDYLFENDLVERNIINVFSHDTIIYDYIIKYGKEDLLKFINEKALGLMYNGKMLIDYIVEKNIIPTNINSNEKVVKRIVELGKVEILKDVYDDTLNIEIDDEGTTLANYMFDNDIIPDSALSSIKYNGKHALEYAKKICEMGRFDLLENASEELLLKNVYSENTLFEDLIRDGRTPKPYLPYKSIESLKLLFKYNMYDSLGDFSSNLYLTKLDNGKLLIEELLDRKLSFSKRVFIKERRIIKYLIKYERYDLFKNISSEILYSQYDLNNTYLDLALLNAKSDEEIKWFDSFSSDLKTKAKKYIIFARHNLQMYLSSLDKEDLLKKQNGKRLIDILLEMDSNLTIDRILKNTVKEDFEIAMIIRMSGNEQKNIKFDSVTRDFMYEYNKSNNDKYNENDLSPEDKEIIAEFRRVMSDGKSDPKILDTLISSYISLLARNSKYALEIRHIINIKKENPDFSYKRIETGAYYSSIEKSVSMDNENIDTLNHETGHALFHNLTNGEYPYEFEKAMDKMKNNKDFLKRVQEYSEMFHLIESEVENRVERTYMKEYDKSITEDKIKEIEKFIMEEKNSHREEYIKKGIKASTVDRILNETYTLEEYLEQDRRIKKSELIDLIMRIEYGPFTAIGDYIDGIVNGRFRDNKLISEDGKVIKHAYGHGLNYYLRGSSWAFDEMLANFSEIVKSENPEDGLNALRYFIGNEIIDIISDYYDNDILHSKKYEVTQGHAL